MRDERTCFVYIMASKPYGAWKIDLIERTNPDWHDLYPAMRKYELKGPLSEPGWAIGPRDGAAWLRPDGLPEDDTRG